MAKFISFNSPEHTLHRCLGDRRTYKDRCRINGCLFRIRLMSLRRFNETPTRDLSFLRLSLLTPGALLNTDRVSHHNQQIVSARRYLR